MRVEKDLLGERNVPEDVYYGIYTLRAVENFPLSGIVVHKQLIGAMALIKKAAAKVNGDLGYIEKFKVEAIIKATEDVCAGKLSNQFVVDALQGGAGTSTNMNVNEVIANRALEILGEKFGKYDLIHPINQVNMHQSTNDIYPSALKIAAIWLLKPLSEACATLQAVFQEKEQEFADVIKVGRTQLQDAVPIMLGQEFSAYAQALERDRWRIYKVEERLRQINLGGTAVGTGINTDIKYIYMVNDLVRQYAGVGLARAENMIDATQNADVFVEVSGLLKALAVNLSKIAHDLRLLSSGPIAGFGDIILPERQAGSSIMPGKINPIIPEAVNQVGFQVIAADAAITMAAQSGQLELNAFLPLIAHHLLHSIELLTNTIIMFRDNCIKGIKADREKCRANLDNSFVTVTALVPYIGYDRATLIATIAKNSHKSVYEVVIDSGILLKADLDIILNPENMTHPGKKRTITEIK